MANRSLQAAHAARSKLPRRIASVRLPTFRGLVARAGYKLLPALGYDVKALGPGAVLVSRAAVAGIIDVKRLIPGTFLVSRAAVAGKSRLVTTSISPGTAVVTEPFLARQHLLDREKAFFSHIENDHIAGVLEKYRVNCVLDVGANRGQYSRRLRAAGYSGYIVSFEPVPHLFEKLEQNASGDPKWTVHRVALGAEDDVTSMHVVPQTAKGWQGGLSSILAPTAYGKGRYGVLRETVTEEVPLRRLDGLLDSVIAHVPDPRIYLKLDTQGYDLQVFEGLGSRAADLVGLQSEVALVEHYEGMPRMPQALEVYEEAGFAISGLFLVSRERRTWRVVEYDCIMVRASALEEPPEPSS